MRLYSQPKMNRRQKMKLLKKLISVFLCICMLGGALMAVACDSGSTDGEDDGKNNGKDQIVVSETVVNVRVYKGGYGTNWIYELAEKFEETYADMGYKINIMKPSSDIQGTVVENELSVGGGGIDLYIAGNVVEKNVSNYVEDLTELVWNQKPVKFDGTEEDILYKDKIADGMEEYSIANGKHCSAFYMTAANGMVINTKKLAMYGLSIPKTSDELIACYDVIATGKGTSMGDSNESNIFATTFLASANGYPSTYWYTALAQYLGYEEYQKFISLDNNGEHMTADGYKMYANEKIIDVNELMFNLFDEMYATNGVKTQNVVTAQSKVMLPDQGAVFYICGDWFLNEEAKDYKNYLNDIAFAKFPVISALGTELFGKNSTLKLSDADADKLLSYIIGLADENKTAEEVVSLVKSEKGYTITEAAAQRVIEARGIYYNRGVEHTAYITKGSQSKDVAALFLRYMASDDAAKLIADESNGTTCFSSNIVVDSDYEFVNQAAETIKSNAATAIFRQPGATDSLSMNVPELVARISPKETEYIAQYVVNKEISKYNIEDWEYNVVNANAYRDAAVAMFNSDKAYVAEKWSKWMKDYGFGD